MQISKLSIILIFGCAVLFFGIGIFLLTQLIGGGPEEQEPTRTPVGNTSTYQQNITEGTAIRTKDGNYIPVRDFKSDPDVSNWYDDPAVFLLAESEVDSEPLYQIFYYEVDNSIGISLLQPPLGFARQQAERALKEKIGLSEAQLCDALIMVNTPSFVDPDLAGQELGLSFCPNFVSLP